MANQSERLQNIDRRLAQEDPETEAYLDLLALKAAIRLLPEVHRSHAGDQLGLAQYDRKAEEWYREYFPEE